MTARVQERPHSLESDANQAVPDLEGGLIDTIHHEKPQKAESENGVKLAHGKEHERHAASEEISTAMLQDRGLQSAYRLLE